MNDKECLSMFFFFVIEVVTTKLWFAVLYRRLLVVPVKMRFPFWKANKFFRWVFEKSSHGVFVQFMESIFGLAKFTFNFFLVPFANPLP
jgi:hypothetical protein